MLRLLTGSAITVGLGLVGTLKARQLFQNGIEDLQAAELQAAKKIGVTHQPLPTRGELLYSLRHTPEFDVLVIGGGATGCGVALDAVTRGLNTALVEKYDYSSGTSSRSTKLIHGGVRYLQKAIFNLDYGQYKLVREALHERANLLAIAPHLSNPLPIMLPVYKWWQVPYFWAGIKMYDLVSGKKLVKSSYFLSKEKALENFPMLKSEKLCGAIVYYDGQHNDARMNLCIALSAIRRGATCLNHVEVIKLLKKTEKKDGEEDKEIVCGARLRERFSGEEWDVYAKSVINATGPFTDNIRRMDDSKSPKICQPSSGVHIVLPDYYSPSNMGLLDPATSDGRVIFFLPWESKTIAGTTDSPCDVSFHPYPKEAEIQFVLKEIKDYLNPDVHVRRGDVLAAWSGIRPLVTDPSSKDTGSISRNHVIEVSSGKMITIAGGKWTTYRKMAEDAVDTAVKACNLTNAKASETDGLILEGGEGWTPTEFIRLIQDYGLEPEVAKHLSRSYGTKAPQVAKLAKLTGQRWPVVGQRLIDEFPYIEAEIYYGLQEYACTAIDMMARRLRVSFLNCQAAEEVLPEIIEIMSNNLGWDKDRRQKELEEALWFLDEMGYKNRMEVRNIPVNFTKEEITKYTTIFRSFDINRTGHVTAPVLRKILKGLGETDVTDEQLQELIAEVDLNMNNTIELDEFLQLMSALKTGAISNNRLGSLVERHYHHLLDPISTERSGGGI